MYTYVCIHALIYVYVYMYVYLLINHMKNQNWYNLFEPFLYYMYLFWSML